MKTNIFAFDVETTGLIKYLHGIVTIAWIIQAPTGEVLDKGGLKINPFTYMPTCRLDAKALKINGYTEDDIKTFPNAKKQIRKLLSVLNKHWNGEKYTVVAFNADFDTGFLQELMNKVVPNTYWKLLNYKHIDPFAIVKWFQHVGIIDTGKSQSLAACAKYYDYQHIPHNASSDIEVTLKLYNDYIQNFSLLKAIHSSVDYTIIKGVNHVSKTK